MAGQPGLAQQWSVQNSTDAKATTPQAAQIAQFQGDPTNAQPVQFVKHRVPDPPRALSTHWRTHCFHVPPESPNSSSAVTGSCKRDALPPFLVELGVSGLGKLDQRAASEMFLKFLLESEVTVAGISDQLLAMLMFW